MRTNEDLLRRTKVLAELRDGWYDGAGKAPDPNSYAHFTTMLLQHYPFSLPTPALIPTQEGNLLLEWKGLGEPTVDIDLTTMRAMFQGTNKDDTEVDASFELRDDDDWRMFMVFLDEQLGNGRVADAEER